MEFRSCPACKASVLEEDVAECPFCGASMSGKPQPASPQKPAARKAAAAPASKSPSKPAASASGTPRPKSPAGGRPTKSAPASASSGSDDPFEVDTSAMRRAIKLAPRPTKSRTLEVVCPMCETHGFMPPSEAGKDVHCCNPECLVPVFKTERPQVAEEPTEEPPPNRWPWIAGGVAALVMIGVGVWFFVLAPDQNQENVVVEPPKPVEPIDTTNLTPNANAVVVEVEAPPATLAEIRKKALETILDFARRPDRNRSSDYGVQLAAEAFADADQLKKAQQQIQRLQTYASGAPYLQIQPLVEIGWRQLANGKLTDAQNFADAALEKTKNLPRSIRKTQDAVTSLAALLAATDRPDQTQKLIQSEQNDTPRARMSMLWRSAVDSRSFQIDQEARRPWHLIPPEPMRMAIVETLVARGYPEKGLQIAEKGQNTASIAACRAAWAGRIAQLDPQHAVDRISAMLKDVQATPEAQCQAWAAAAAMASSQKQQPLSKMALDKAVAAAAEIEVPTLAAVPALRNIHNSDGKPHAGLPDPSPALSAVLAFASLATAQLDAGQREAAWTNFQKAVDSARGMAPSPAATQQLVEDCENQESTLRSQLNAALNLENNPQAVRNAFIRYRRTCGALNAQAQRRLELQVAILRFAAMEGFIDQVWRLADDRSRSSDLQTREPYLDTTLPGLIHSLATAQENSELAKNIEASFTEKDLTVDPIDAIFANAAAALSRGQLMQTSDIIERGYRSNVARKQPDRLDEVALRFCSQVQQTATPKQIVEFIKNLYDEPVQEDAFLLLAGNAMQQGTAPELWKTTSRSRDLAALDHVSLFRGFIAGLSNNRTGQEPSPSSAPENRKAK